MGIFGCTGTANIAELSVLPPIAMRAAGSGDDATVWALPVHSFVVVIHRFVPLARSCASEHGRLSAGPFPLSVLVAVIMFAYHTRSFMA